MLKYFQYTQEEYNISNKEHTPHTIKTCSQMIF
jgi:hypothetical protein